MLYVLSAKLTRDILRLLEPAVWLLEPAVGGWLSMSSETSSAVIIGSGLSPAFSDVGGKNLPLVDARFAAGYAEWDVASTICLGGFEVGGGVRNVNLVATPVSAVPPADNLRRMLFFGPPLASLGLAGADNAMASTHHRNSPSEEFLAFRDYL